VLIDMFQKPTRDTPRLSALARIMSETAGLREAYGSLYAGIRLDACFAPGTSVLVTSTQPSEGKTTVASCLAITASLAGQSTLLIDGDLRRPWLARATGIADGVGFSDVLDGGVEPAEATHTIELHGDQQEVYCLRVMSAGRKSPAFLPAVDWTKAKTAFRLLSKQFGIVVLDSPPILAAKDALLLAGIVDAVLLVVAAGSADRDEVRRAKDQLEPTGARVIGAVLNKFDPKLHGRSNQPYCDHYLEMPS
jgi:capsular exopolysaccharide synthesis family protein